MRFGFTCLQNGVELTAPEHGILPTFRRAFCRKLNGNFERQRGKLLSLIMSATIMKIVNYGKTTSSQRGNKM